MVCGSSVLLHQTYMTTRKIENLMKQQNSQRHWQAREKASRTCL